LRGIHLAKATACLLLLGFVCPGGDSLRAAEQGQSDALVQMIVELVNDSDRDMQALGLQQVREEAAGEAATKTFAALLPKLPPDAQAGLLEALGDRKDAAARPAVLEMLASSEEAVRAAALRALGALGTAAEVPLLAGKLDSGSELEKKAARQSLIRLRPADANRAIVAALGEGKPNVRVQLLDVLATRNAKEALPSVLAGVKDPERSVRLAALGALRFMADEKNTAEIVKIVKATTDDGERRKAALALLAVCSRSRQKCTEALVAGLAGADVPSRIVLLRGLGRAGGAASLEAVVGCLNSEDQPVCDEAVRMLSIWPDKNAVPHLLKIASTSQSLRHQVLAIRGLVRLASPEKDKPADLKMLSDVISLAKRPQEKCLVLGVLGGIPTPPSLALVTPALDEAALAEEAALAAVMIAEKIQDGNKDEIRAAMEKVLKSAKGRQIRQRAQKILESL